MPTIKSKATTVGSGITTTQSGDRHIPESVRADGSVRKEIKIRPGYRPPEDVEIYKNRTAEAYKNRGTGGIPGAEDFCSESGEKNKSVSNKNAKRREARRNAKANDLDTEPKKAIERVTGEESLVRTIGKIKISSDAGEATSDIQTAAMPIDEAAEREKLVRALRKKLRQAKDLQLKKDTGATLLPEQLAKVIRIQELTRQLMIHGINDDEDAELTK